MLPCRSWREFGRMLGYQAGTLVVLFVILGVVLVGYAIYYLVFKLK
jgi:hypothetical protein